jgi:hypothetical protein
LAPFLGILAGWFRNSGPIVDRIYSFFMGAMRAAIIAAPGFDTVADNFASTVLALRSKRMNSAFETIEITRDSVDHDLEGLVVFVAANFTNVHTSSCL